MGCDIHSYVEQQDDEDNWKQIHGFQSDYYDPNSQYFSTEQFSNADSPIDGRNYYMFAIMVDVRNEDGAVTPISEPRGLPDDVSSEIKKESEEWGVDGHSHSWLTVKDLMNYDQDQMVTHKGLVEFQHYIETKKDNKEYDSWCGGVYGGNTITLEESDVDTEVKQVAVALEYAIKDIYIRTTWKTRVSQYCKTFFGSSLDQLKARCKSPHYDDVRLVFWFDN